LSELFILGDERRYGLNKLEKTSIVRVLTLILSIAFSSLSLAALTDTQETRVQTVSRIKLTPNELVWLSRHKTVRVGFDSDFPPYSFVGDSGQIEGVAIDIIKLISERLSINIEVVPYNSWNELYDAAAAKNIDAVATMVDRPERREWFNFTQPYLSKSLVIIARKDIKGINSRADVAGKTVALLRNYQYVDRVLEEFPSLTPFFVGSITEGLESVDTGKAEAFIGFSGVGYFLSQRGLFPSLKVVTFYDHNSANESIAVRKDWPVLAEILRKGLDSLSADEKQAIFDKWVPQAEPMVDFAFIAKLLGAMLIVLILLISWLIQIRRQNKKIELSNQEALLANKKLQELQMALEALVVQRTSELRVSEQKFRSLVENLRDEYFFYRQDLEGRFTYVSPSVTSILGFNQDEFKADFKDYLSDNPVNQKIQEKLAQCIQGELQPVYQIEIYHANGDLHWLELLNTPVYNEKGDCIGVDTIAHDVTARREAQEILTSLSYYDELTGLANRRLFSDRLQQTLNLAHRNKWSVSLFYLDLDRFKSVNDSYGHSAGDEVLKETAKRMVSVLRDSDVAARMGGDEFLLLLPETDADAAIRVAEKLLKILLLPYYVDEHILTLGASIGVAVYPEHTTDGETLINYADTAMYSAKDKKLGFAFYTKEMQELQVSQAQLAEDLAKAVRFSQSNEKNEFSAGSVKCPTSQFSLYYQTYHSLSNNQIVGYEALIRWNHPVLGAIGPIDFLPLAEQKGYIGSITQWMFSQVCAQLLIWNSEKIRPPKMSVNLALSEINSPNWAGKILTQLEQLKVNPAWFTIDLKESAFLNDYSALTTEIALLKKAGVTVCIDDFGGQTFTGLKSLAELPVDLIKLDRRLLRNIPGDTESVKFIQDVIRTALPVGKAVVAKGVETQDQLDTLQKYGCDCGQGFLFCKPLPGNEVQAFTKSLQWFLN